MKTLLKIKFIIIVTVSFSLFSSICSSQSVKRQLASNLYNWTYVQIERKLPGELESKILENTGRMFGAALSISSIGHDINGAHKVSPDQLLTTEITIEGANAFPADLMFDLGPVELYQGEATYNVLEKEITDVVVGILKSAETLDATLAITHPASGFKKLKSADTSLTLDSYRILIASLSKAVRRISTRDYSFFNPNENARKMKAVFMLTVLLDWVTNPSNRHYTGRPSGIIAKANERLTIEIESGEIVSEFGDNAATINKELIDAINILGAHIIATWNSLGNEAKKQFEDITVQTLNHYFSIVKRFQIGGVISFEIPEEAIGGRIQQLFLRKTNNSGLASEIVERELETASHRLF